MGSRFPELRKLWILISGPLYHFMWIFRKVLTANRPIQIQISNKLIYMVPEGHIAELMWHDWFEKEERDMVAYHIRQDMIVINIGANTGLYTLLAAKLVGKKGAVHAFEPSSLNFARLTRNVILNEFDNVFLNQMALSDFTGTLALVRDAEHPELDSHYYVQRVEDGIPPKNTVELIPCDTIDNYWWRKCDGELRKVDIIIMDVEGAELSVLEGMLGMLAASPDLLLMIEFTEKLDELNNLLLAEGFTLYSWNVATKCFDLTIMRRGTIYAMRNSIIKD